MNKFNFLYLPILLLTACGNPGEISDEEYTKYKELGTPKIIYSCATTYDWRNSPSGLLERAHCALMPDVEKAVNCTQKLKDITPITTVNVGYVAGIGLGVTYNKLLTDARDECSGEFKILESEQ